MRTYDNFVSPTYLHLKVGPINKKVSGKYPPSTTYYQETTTRVGPALNGMPFLTSTMPELSSFVIPTELMNRLYSKYREELLGSKGELLTSFLEWNTSLEMISGRARTIYGAYSAVRRFRFKEAARILNIATPARYKNLSAKRAQKKKLSPTGVWLEYWMGWAPLYGDIANAIDTLQGKPDSIRSFSVGVADMLETVKISGSYAPEKSYRKTVYRRKVSLSAYGRVKVTNHNLHLADKLGFTNPILSAWQMFPFSFMVDWFMNIGTVLGSLTDFAGLEILDNGLAYKVESTATVEGRSWYYGFTPIGQSAWSVMKYRDPGKVPSPKIAIKMLDKLSLTRAATSISLLTEIFLRK